MRALFFALLGLLFVAAPLQAQSGGGPKELAVGSELRKELFDLLRPRVGRVAKQKVKFAGSLKQLGNWAFFNGRAVDENGEDIAIGDAESSSTAALWNRKGGAWTLVKFSAGFSDVVYIDWPEEHGFPKALIGE